MNQNNKALKSLDYIREIEHIGIPEKITMDERETEIESVIGMTFYTWLKAMDYQEKF